MIRNHRPAHVRCRYVGHRDLLVKLCGHRSPRRARSNVPMITTSQKSRNGHQNLLDEAGKVALVTGGSWISRSWPKRWGDQRASPSVGKAEDD